MPGKRAAGQKLIGTQADEKLKELVVSAKGRGKSVSDFVREALVEKLQRMGFDVDPNLMFPPDRAAISIVAEHVTNYGPGAHGDTHNTINKTVNYEKNSRSKAAPKKKK